MDFMSEELLYQKSSQQVTAILYEGCLQHLDDAVRSIEDKNYMQANKSLQQANDILHRLGIGLKYEAGVIAEQLDTLYNYMANRLIEANMKKDVTIVKEVQKIIQTISDAWHTSLEKKDVQITKKSTQKNLASYEQNVRTMPIE